MVGVSGEGRRGRVQTEGQRKRESVGKRGEGPPRTGRGGEGGVGQISSYCTKCRCSRSLVLQINYHSASQCPCPDWLNSLFLITALRCRLCSANLQVWLRYWGIGDCFSVVSCFPAWNLQLKTCAAWRRLLWTATKREGGCEPYMSLRLLADCRHNFHHSIVRRQLSEVNKVIKTRG